MISGGEDRVNGVQIITKLRTSNYQHEVKLHVVAPTWDNFNVLVEYYVHQS